MSAPVTFHATLRWLERVCGVDVDALRATLGPEASDCLVVKTCAAALRMTVAELEDHVCPPSLAAAVRLGASRIHRDGHTLVCSDRLVVTVTTPRAEDRARGWSGVSQRRGIARRSDRRGRFDQRSVQDDVEERV